MSSKPSYEDLEIGLQELKTKISEEKAREKILKESRDLYQGLFDHAGVAMSLVDLKTGKATAFNKKAYQDLGYTPEEFEAKGFQGILADEVIEIQRLMNHIIQNEGYAYNSKLRKKDGTVMDAFTSTVLVNLAGKKHIHTVQIDVSKQKQIENQLREREERYLKLLESMDEGYYEVDVTGNMRFFNSALVRMYGYPADELIGMNNRDFMTPETAKKVYGFVNELYSTGKSASRTLDYEAIKKDGSIIFVEVSVSLIRDINGAVTGFRGLVRDATDKKSLERELKEKEEIYRMLFEHAGFAMTLTDARTGKRVAYNKLSYQQLGYSEEEYKQVTFRDNFVSSDKKLSELIKDLLEKENNSYFSKLRRKDGEVLDFYVSSVKLKIGGKTHFHDIRVDVTGQKRAEQELKESESRFHTIFEAAADAIFLLDAHTMQIIDANIAACNALGYEREKLLKMSLLDLTVNQTDDYFPSRESISEFKFKGIDFYETALQKKDGSLMNVEVSSCFLEQDKSPVILSIARDITQRKHTEEELAGYRKNLEQMVEKRTRELKQSQKKLVEQEKLAVLGQLSTTVSYKLQNPLGEVRSSNDYLQKQVQNDDEKVNKHLKRIENQVDICDALIAGLLEYTEATPEIYQKADIYSWLPQFLNQFQGMEDILLDVVIPDNVPLIVHDPLKIQQVIYNLMDNAVLAVKEKRDQYKDLCIPYQPRISVTINKDRNHTIFEILDNGVGMERQNQSKAFSPLFTTRARGSGMGLANAYKIILNHNGQMNLSGNPGKGTRVSFTLPNDGDQR